MPGIARLFLTQELRKIAEELPALPTGRKQALTLEQRIQVRDYVSDLYKVGVSIQISKQRAAQKFGVSLRSVERAWSRRKDDLNLEKPNIPAAELIAWMSKREPART